MDSNRDNNFTQSHEKPVNSIKSRLSECSLITDIESHYCDENTDNNPHIEFQIKSDNHGVPDERGKHYSKSVIKINDIECIQEDMYNVIGAVSIRYPPLWEGEPNKEKRFKDILDRSNPPGGLERYRNYFDLNVETETPHFKTTPLNEQQQKNHQLPGSYEKWVQFIIESAKKFDSEFI